MIYWGYENTCEICVEKFFSEKDNVNCAVLGIVNFDFKEILNLYTGKSQIDSKNDKLENLESRTLFIENFAKKYGDLLTFRGKEIICFNSFSEFSDAEYQHEAKTACKMFETLGKEKCEYWENYRVKFQTKTKEH